MAGNVSGAREVVQRHQFADYLNIGTSEKPNWVLMGVGFTTLDETFGAESESEKYVCEPSSSSSVVSYTDSADDTDIGMQFCRQSIIQHDEYQTSCDIIRSSLFGTFDDI